ncbi:MAG: CotH kinase family protein [Flavobacteriales bacterium]|nr:CotH kinase family protein [Flavobacteriales bacterium]
MNFVIKELLGTTLFRFSSVVILCSVLILVNSCNLGLFGDDLFINEVMSKNTNTVINPDSEYSDWIEIFNNSDRLVDISGYYLNLNKKKKKWQIPQGTFISPKGYLVFWADGKDSGYHTSFKLANKKEKITLETEGGAIIDELVIGNQFNECSYGRSGKNVEDKGYFAAPTAGKENAEEVIRDPVRIDSPQIRLLESNNSSAIEITSDCAGCEVRYTLDGSTPNWNSNVYEGVVKVDSPIVVRAKNFKKNSIPSETVTRTYIAENLHSLPIVSIVTDPKNLWDDYIGIYAEGKNGIAGNIGPVANWNQDWEREANIEYFDNSGNCEFNEKIGIKILGQYINTFPQKPIGIYFKSKYGNKKLNYQLFKDKNIDQFSRFVVRVADWGKTNIRDGVMGAIAQDMNVDKQSYQPVVTYLNGKYWGIYEMREKLDNNFIASNHQINADSIDMIENALGIMDVNSGDGKDYNELMSYLQNNDLNTKENYEYVANQVDLDNFLDYIIAQIYFANIDWPGNNLRCWKEKGADGKWRWILFDSDVGLDNYNQQLYNHNTLGWAMLAASGDDVHCPPHSTLLIRKMFQNQEFCRTFIQRFSVHLNTTFQTERLLNIVDSMQNQIAMEMPLQIKKWGDMKVYGISHSYSSMEVWNNNVDVINTFVRKRPDVVWSILKGTFNLGATINLSIKKGDGGYLLIDDVPMKKQYSGKHFQNVPVILKAIAKEGYTFIGWEGDSRTEANIQIVLTQNATLKPIFKKVS